MPRFFDQMPISASFFLSSIFKLLFNHYSTPSMNDMLIWILFHQSINRRTVQATVFTEWKFNYIKAHKLINKNP